MKKIILTMAIAAAGLGACDKRPQPLTIDNALTAEEIAAGVLTPVRVSDARRVELGEEYAFTAESRCMIALDGEREVRVQPGDEVKFVINRDGPWRVVPRRILARASELGMYRIK